MLCGSSPMEALWRVDGGESGSRQRRARRTGAGLARRQSRGTICAAVPAYSPSLRGGQRGMQCSSGSMKTLCGADDGRKRQPPASVTAHRRRPALLQSEGAVLAAIPACSPSPRGGQRGTRCGSSPHRDHAEGWRWGAAGDGPGAPARAPAAAVRGRNPRCDPGVQSEPAGGTAKDAERQ